MTRNDDILPPIQYKEIIKILLESGDCAITFDKLDGTERTLVATQIPESVLESIKQQEPKEPRPGNDKNVTVWSRDDKGFRSIRIESIKRIEPV